jgi:hypothetical protein
MGRYATDFLPALRSGFADFAEQAEAAGVIIEDEVIQKLDALGDKWGTLGKQLMVTLAPPLAWLADKIHVINVGLSATLAALKSIGTDFKNDALGTIANFLFPTSGSFGGNPLTRAKEAAQKAGFATIRGYENAKSGPPTLNEAIEIEEEVKEKKKRERQARIEQISDVSNHTISTDAMQRMGLYIGPVSQLKQVADRQLSELKAVRSHMSKMLQIAEEER